MANTRRFEINELFPQPKEIILGEGISELAMDVRLATSNVLPIQRKALRSILTMAGVRVVANKKRYVVDAQVLGPEEFDLSKVPESVRMDFYELEIKNSEVFIRTPYQEGMVWAAQTLATLFDMMFKGKAVPNLIIRDWPMIPHRGVIMDGNWGTERMVANDWFQALDTMSAMHLNLCGFGIYDCYPDIRMSGYSKPSEFLMTMTHLEPTSNEPSSESRLRYYNVKYDRWYDKTVSPALFENDNFEEVLTYAHERGIIIFPVMNLMGRSTLLPKLIPALSACDEKGKPTGYGLCLTSAAARAALSEHLGAFLERYFEEGVEYFHLGFDDLSDIHPHANDGLPESVWCKCSKCKKLSHAKAFAQFLKWIVEFLASKNVGKVVLFSDQLLKGEKLLGSDLEALLKDKSFASKVIIDWEEPGNEGKSKVWKSGDAKFKDVDAWQSPLVNKGNYSFFSSYEKTVDEFVLRAMKEKSDGVLVRGQYDPAYLHQVAMLGVRCWETPDLQEDTL
ncbi:MAG: glycoside hydrolase family 20 zincin-like fold domain-containing protein, partial [Lentisphaeria bacterium]|nr:glycoside hydrolase family 20 zincin-like fold domain-containing protein [Lentisphaeria bacterium]